MAKKLCKGPDKGDHIVRTSQLVNCAGALPEVLRHLDEVQRAKGAAEAEIALKADPMLCS